MTRVAVIHDWLVIYGGAERVLEELLGLFPDADVFSLIDYVPQAQRGFLGGRPVHTSFIQQLPFARRGYRRYLPLMPTAVERFDLSSYDLIISSSSAVAKGVLTTPDQLHICYLQARNLKYAYEDRHSYHGGGVRRLAEDLLLTRIRMWDSVASRRPDYTIANSHYVRRWQLHRHGVPSTVIYPPVDTAFFASSYRESKEDYYVTVGRLEPYKRMRLVVEAFRELPYRLVVVGDGTELPTLRRLAGPNVEFVGYCQRDEVARLVSRARAFVFASREDFGIAPIEAQACGTPAIVFDGGGAVETIRSIGEPAPTGIFFDTQTVEAIVTAVQQFERARGTLDPDDCRTNAQRFSREQFRQTFSETVDAMLEEFRRRQRDCGGTLTADAYASTP